MSEQTHSPLPQRSPTAPQAGHLTFAQALDKLLDGKKVSKKEWGDEGIYIFLSDTLRIRKDDKVHDLIVQAGDIQGTDWFVITETVEKEAE